jgi:hypothetical protein
MRELGTATPYDCNEKIHGIVILPVDRWMW